MYSKNIVQKNIYFQYFKAGSKVIGAYSVIAITLRYISRYHVTLYHSIEKLSLLNVIAVDSST
jgi:hypothetical protein